MKKNVDYLTRTDSVSTECAVFLYLLNTLCEGTVFVFRVLDKMVGAVAGHLSPVRILRLFTATTVSILFLSITVVQGWASPDLTIFGPEKFERLKGKPTVYTELFPGCAGSDQALIKIVNGGDRETRIKSGIITINGQTVFSEKDFKQKALVLEARIQVKDENELQVVLKSGHHNDDETLDRYLLEKVILERELAKLLHLQENQETGEGDGSDREDDDHDRDDNDHEKDKNDKERVKNSKYTKMDDLQEEIEEIKEKLAELERKIAKLEKRPSPFLLIEVIGKGCDDTPPTFSSPVPSAGLLLNSSTTGISLDFRDEANGSGIDTSSVVLSVDGFDVTASSAVSESGFIYQPTNPLSEGGHVVLVQIADLAKNSAEFAWSFSIDTIAPVATIMSPFSDSWLNTPTITVYGSVDDPTATVTVNGQAATISGNGFTVANVSLSEGVNGLTVNAIDSAGNNSLTYSIEINLDTIAPVITVAAPLPWLFVNTDQIAVNGSVNEPVQSVVVNGYNSELNNTAFSVPAVTLSEGDNDLLITATDRAGNKGTVTVAVNLDTDPPVVTITSPLTGSLTNQTLTDIVASVNETILSAAVNGTSAVIDGQAVSLSGLSLAEGVNSLTVSAVDRAGNTGSAVVQVTIDTIPPAIPVLTQPTSPTNLSGLTLNGQAEALAVVKLLVAGPSESDYTVQSVVVADTDGNFNFGGLILTEGSTRFAATATDAAGNESGQAVEVTVMLDIIAPQVTIDAPLDGLFRNTAAIAVDGSVNEPTAEVTVNGQRVIINDLTYSLVELTLLEGANSIVVSATDLAGNKGTAAVAVTLDTFPPQVTITAPVADSLTNIPTANLLGSANEILTSISVNGLAGQFSSQDFSYAGLTLTEGTNSLAVTVTDRAGNSGSATVALRLDATAPETPLLNPVASPTNNAVISLSGSAESGATVELVAATPSSSGGTSIANLIADVAGQFAFAGYSLEEGETRFTATATDAAGNKSVLSAELAVVLDTIAPVITLLSPADQSISEVLQITVVGTVDDPTADLVIDGNPVLLASDGSFAHPLTLQPGPNGIILLATDAAGNAGSAGLTVHADSTPPVVTISSPQTGLLTNSGQVTISGSVNEPVKSVTVNGVALNLNGTDFSGSYSLQPDSNLLTVEAIDLAGNRGQGVVEVTYDGTAPQLSLTVAPEAAAGETITLQLSASDNREIILLELAADGQPFWSVDSVTGSALQNSLPFTLAPSTASGSTLRFALYAYDSAGNFSETAAVVLVSQGPSGPGYLQGEVYDDTTGLRLENATVRVETADLALEAVTVADGRYLFELLAADYRISVSKEGFTAVDRNVAVAAEQTVTALDARLTPVATQPSIIGFTGGQILASLPSLSAAPVVELTLIEGSLGEALDLRLTPVSGQSLAALLPIGWSPLGVFELYIFANDGQPLSQPLDFFAPAAVRVKLPATLTVESGNELVVVRYDADNRHWVVRDAAIVDATGWAAFNLTAAGQYTVLMADPAAIAPPAAVSGQTLLGSTSALYDPQASVARGEVMPPIAAPAEDLQAAAEIILALDPTFDPTGQLPSGTILVARATEKFDLLSGAVIQPSDYEQDLVLYRYPCATGYSGGQLASELLEEEVRTTFPVTPSRQYTITELMMGKVGIEVNLPVAEVGGVLAGPDGAMLLDADGNSLTIPVGALAQTVPVTIQTVPQNLAAFAVGADMTLIRAIEIDLSRQTLSSSARITLPQPHSFNPARPVLLAKAFETHGQRKLRLVGLMQPVGSLLQSSPEITATLPLDGVVTSGTYYVLQAKGPLGFVRGQVTGGGSPLASALMTSDSLSIADLSKVDGSFVVPVGVGISTVEALDLDRFDIDSATVTITTANEVMALDLAIAATPPQLVILTPADAATGVEPNTSIVLTFSEPVERATVGSQSVLLRNADDQVLPGVFSFSPDNTVITFYPAAALISETTHTITVSGSIRDLQGYSLGADQTTSFIVRDTTPPPRPAAGAISASFPDANGFITVTATQGTAEYDSTVLLLNDFSGEIVSISPQSDGSFIGKIIAQLGDEIQVLLIDPAGNQTLISYLTFKSPDGRFLVTAKGGKVEGEGGLLLEIPEGALVGPTVVKITPVEESALPHPVPEGGVYLQAVNVDTGGVRFKKEVKLSIPAPENLPAESFPFVAQPGILVNPDGSEEEVYEIIDTVKIIDGRLITASPPFDGIFGYGIFSFVCFPQLSVAIVDGTTYSDMDGDNIYTVGTDQPIKGAVIRSPQAWNFVSYSRDNGFYAVLGEVFDQSGVDGTIEITAIHPMTMARVVKRMATTTPLLVRGLNIKLADSKTSIPDNVVPVIEFGLRVAPDQISDPRLIAGTLPVGAELSLSISAIDSDMQSASLSVEFKASDMESFVPVTPSPSLSFVKKELLVEKTTITLPRYRYLYTPQFSGEIASSDSLLFKPAAIGTYTLTVTAKDMTGNESQKSLTVRSVDVGELPLGIDGWPRIDEILPNDSAKDVMVTTSVIVTFSEPVENVNEQTLKLVDDSNGIDVPAYVYTTLEGGRMRATLQPIRNLLFSHKYRVVATTDITDMVENPGFNNEKLPFENEVTSEFSTKVPRVFDLSEDEQFASGFNIARYDDSVNGRSYVYVTAKDNGWRVIDVTDPTKPKVVYQSPVRREFSYRGVAVEQQKGVLAITENISLGSSQFGYVRFYDLTENPTQPRWFGQEKLAEAMTGIPGRLALQGDYAYIVTIGAGVQVVDVAAARADTAVTDGSNIVGIYDSITAGYGHPNNVSFYAADKAVVTTNTGWLILLDTAYPSMPRQFAAFRPDDYQAVRAAAISGYSYVETSGNVGIMDLAVTVGLGRLQTVDLSDPYSPKLLGSAVDDIGEPVVVYANDIAISKTAGLVFVSGYSMLQVFDIKDPFHPLLLHTITQLPDANGDLQPIGVTTGLLELGGWVYLANNVDGMRVLDLDPSVIKVINTSNYELGETDEFKFGNDTNEWKHDKIYHIEVAITSCPVNSDDDKPCNTLCNDGNYSGELSVLLSKENSMPAQSYNLTFSPKTGSLNRCKVNIKGDNNSTLNRFIVSNREPNLLPDMLKLTGGLGNQIQVHVKAILEEVQDKYFTANIEPVGVIVLAIDGLRQDVLYKPESEGGNEASYNDPHGCGLNQTCYVETEEDTLPGLYQILKPELGEDSPTIKIPGVTSIFPSITLASWASIFSGKMPNETGIMGNEFFARDLYALNNSEQPNDKLSVGVPARFDAPKGMISLDGGSFKGFGAFPKPWSFYAKDFFVPYQFNWKNPVAHDWTMPLRATHEENQPQDNWKNWTPQNDPRIYTATTLFEELRDNTDVNNYYTLKGGDPVVVSYNHYARGAYWLTWDTEIASNSSRILDKSSWDKFEEYLGKYDTYNDLPLPTKRNTTPFSALTVWYLPGLDHEAHIEGMGEYKKYFKSVIDDKIKKFVEKLKALDEFENKIFIVVSDHGHTAMPTDFEYEHVEKMYDVEGTETGILKSNYAVEITCETKVDKFYDENMQKMEKENNNLHIYELAQVMAMFNKKVLAPKDLLKAGKEVVKGMTTDIDQADIIAGLNGPMAHIYVKGTTDWSSVPDDNKIKKFADIFKVSFRDGFQDQTLSQDMKESIKKLLSSIDKILIWDSALGYYKVFGNEPPYDSIAYSETFPQDKYVEAELRINGLRDGGKDNQRSGDIVLLMKDDVESTDIENTNIKNRYTTGAACKSWHGSLNPSDSYVPLIIAYPGGTQQLVEEQQKNACETSGCEANWDLGDIVKTIIESQYKTGKTL